MQFEGTALVLLIILCFGLVMPELFRRLKLPYVSVLILVGALFGPYGWGYVQSDSVLEFFGFLGSAFLMLMAGLEVKLKHLENLGRRIIIMALINGLVPFVIGLGIMRWFGYDWLPSLLIGTIFVSSSVAIVAAGVRAAGLAKNEIGEMIIGATVLLDITSLLLLAVLLQGVQTTARLPLPLYFVVLIASVFILKKFMPLFARYYLRHVFKNHKKDEDEAELRFVIALLIGVLLYFSGLGVHPIVAAFIVGLLLSDVITSQHLFHKIHTLGYGLFVPVFFFVVGMQLNVQVFTQFDVRDVLIVSLIAGSILAKLSSGFVAARLVRFSKNNALMFGVASMAQLTTTLAVTYAASDMNIIGPTLVTAVLLLAVITTMVSPMVLGMLARRSQA